MLTSNVCNCLYICLHFFTLPTTETTEASTWHNRKEVTNWKRRYTTEHVLHPTWRQDFHRQHFTLQTVLTINGPTDTQLERLEKPFYISEVVFSSNVRLHKQTCVTKLKITELIICRIRSGAHLHQRTFAFYLNHLLHWQVRLFHSFRKIRAYF